MRELKKYKKIGDLKTKNLKVEYGPVSDPKRSCIDFLVELNCRLPANYEVDDLRVNVIDYIPPQPYPKTDRSSMPPHYLCGGSLGFNFYDPLGRKASLYLVDFFHSPHHHNPWLWGWDFDNNPIHDKTIPDHDNIPISDDMSVTLTFGDGKITKIFKGEQ